MNPKHLYTYLPKDNTAEKDGILSTALSPDAWQRYKSWAAGDTKEEVLDAMDAQTPGRSKAISVFTDNPANSKKPLPDNIKRIMKARQLYMLPSYEELKKRKLVEALYQVAMTRDREKTLVDAPEYKKINWQDTVPLPGRNDWSRLPHYLMVTTKGKIPAELVKPVQ